MVKVERGRLQHLRPTGYQQYITRRKRGAAIAIRRTLPVTNQTPAGGTPAQKEHIRQFATASRVYASMSLDERQYYKDHPEILIEAESPATTRRRLLKGQRLAMHTIIRQQKTPEHIYDRPVEFCICAIDWQNNLVPGVQLTITSDRTGKLIYSAESQDDGCFPKGAVFRKDEPFTLRCHEATYPRWSVEKIHRTKYLHILNKILVWHKYGTGWTVCDGWYRTRLFAMPPPWSQCPSETFKISIQFRIHAEYMYQPGGFHIEDQSGDTIYHARADIDEEVYIPHQLPGHGYLEIRIWAAQYGCYLVDLHDIYIYIYATEDQVIHCGK